MKSLQKINFPIIVHFNLSCMLVLLLLIFAGTSTNVFSQTATPPEFGDGTASSPYLIQTLDNLYWISQNDSEWNKYYIQINDIDASATAGWNSGAGFVPIGNYDNNFRGRYDGQGHTITGLTIDREETDYIGLFGYVSYPTSVIENVKLRSVNITGADATGALVGYNEDALIRNCSSSGVINGYNSVGGLVGYNIAEITLSYSTASVTATDADFSTRIGGLVGTNQLKVTQSYSTGNVTGGQLYTGGLAGINYTTSRIEDSYSTGDVSGEKMVGGLVGYQNYQYSRVINSYSTGIVSGEENVGGLVGFSNGEATDSFWNINTSGQDTSDGGSGLNTSAMKDSTTYKSAGWDTNNWYFDGDINNGYPYLEMQKPAGIRTEIYAMPPNGDGSENSPYEIETVHNLYWLSQTESVWDDTYFIQTDDIDASDSKHWDRNFDGDPQGFSPIAQAGGFTEFTGHYDGQDHIISGLTIIRDNEDNIGLFGNIDGATIQNVGLTEVNISGKNNTGALAGNVSGSTPSTVSNTFSSGVVYGVEYTGGLIGNTGTLGYLTLNTSYSNANVHGDERFTGGLMGALRGYSTIVNSYSTGDVIGGDIHTGGLVGYNHNSEVIKSYSTGSVSGVDYVGGLIGFSNSGETIDSFWDMETSGHDSSDGGTGKSTSEMKNVATFTDENTEGLSSAWDFEMNPNDDSNNNDNWDIDPTESRNNGYPFLTGQDELPADNEAPYVENHLGQLILDEDFGSITAAVMDSVFTDPDGDALYFEITEYDSLLFSANLNTDTLQIVSENNEFGSGQVIIRATDSGNEEGSDTLMVQVNAVNDLPELTNIPDTVNFQNDADYSLNLDTALFDIEDEISDLDVSVSAQPDEIIIDFDEESHLITISAPDFEGEGNLDISVTDSDGGESETEIIVMVELPTTGEQESGLPTEVALRQNYPNPFNPSTMIRYELPVSSDVRLEIFDLLGRKVATLLDDEHKSVGYHSVTFNADQLSSGMYIYRMETNTTSVTRKMTLIK